MLLAVGVILLWGAGAAREGTRSAWLYGGMTALGLAAVIMLISLSTRKSARMARLLLFRADLKRLDGDRSGAAVDLRELLRITPWDDSAWAELSDDLAAAGRLPDALAAMDEAVKLDPRYDEYRMVSASLAIRTGKLASAREMIRQWVELDGVGPDDPRLTIYQAALELAEGNRAKAEESLKKVLLDRDNADMEFLDTDQALKGVRDLLPGRA